MVELVSTRDLEARRVELSELLFRVGPFRPGSVHETWRRCGKATCRCAREGDPGHGPRVVVVRHVPDRGTRTDSVPADRVEEVGAQVEVYRRFKGLVAELVEVNDQLCHRADAQAAGSRQGPKKGGPRPVRTSMSRR